MVIRLEKEHAGRKYEDNIIHGIKRIMREKIRSSWFINHDININFP